MALTIPTYEEVRDQTLAFFRNRFPGKDSHYESFLGKVARGLGRTFIQFHRSVQTVDYDSVPSQNTSAQGLANMAFAYGLPSGAAGSYGPKVATTASGGVAPCTGTNGTVFADGLLLTAPDGVTVLQLSGAVTISGSPPGTGSVNGNIVAVTPGSAGNLPAGTVLTWQNVPSGADSTVTLSTATEGAIDTEGNSALLARLLDRLQRPPKGGTASDYRTWAESQLGVFRAYVYPLRGGTGTTHTLILQAGSGQSRAPSSGTQTLVNNYINGDGTSEGQRPVTVSDYETLLPYMAATGLSIRIRLGAGTLALAKYGFDWALGTGSLTVASYSATGGVGSAPAIVTNEALPSSLTAAIDAFKAGNGAAPRLQVRSASIANPLPAGAVIPVMVQAIDYNSGTKTITLFATLPTGWISPTASDPIYPGSSVVSTIAANILAYVDGLGPSRAGGYANALDSWQDTCAVYRLAQIALDSIDADGTKFANNVTAVTINGATADYQASDTVANGIEVLYAQNIVVTD